MTNKNPYENGVDIPDFVEKKDDDIDMSVFKMTEDELNKTSYDMDDEYDDEDDEPKRKLSSKGIVIIALVALLIFAVVGWIYGISQKNHYTQLLAEHETLKENYDALTTTNTQLQAQINQLIEELKAKEETTTTTTTSEGETKTEGVKYKFVGDVGVRKEAGSKDGYANFDKLSDAVQDAVNYDKANSTVTTRDNAIIEVISTKDVNGATWGKVDDNAWICIKSSSGEAYATKQ